MIDQTSILGDAVIHLAFRIFSRITHLDDGNSRDRTCAGGSHGAIAVYDVGGVDHTTLPVSRDRYAAADVGYDQVEILITLTDFCGIADSDFFLVERVASALAGDIVESADSCHKLKFIDVGRIDNEGLSTIGQCEIIGQLTAERGRVFHGKANSGMMQQGLIDGIGSPFQADESAASSDKSVYSFQGDVFFSKLTQYGLLTIRKLVADLAKLFELGCFMRDVDGKDLGIVLKQRYLG